MRKTYKKNKAKNTRKHKSVRNKRRKRNYYLTGGAPFTGNLEYWNEIFEPDEIEKLNELRDYIQSKFAEGSKASFTDLCTIMRELVPTFYVPNPPVIATEAYTLNGMTVYPHTGLIHDLNYLNAMLCASFRLFGIIAYKMLYSSCKYKLIFKGGKAIQLVLNNVYNNTKKRPKSFENSILRDLHQSEDIDVLLIPKPKMEYNKTEIRELAENITKLMEWFLASVNTKVSILEPDNPINKNKSIYKLTFVSKYSGFKAFSDIDFGEISTNSKEKYFSDLIPLGRATSNGLGILFECQNIEALLKEKIYYYAYYAYLFYNPEERKKLNDIKKKLDQPTIEEHNCTFFMEKFKRAIISLNRGFHLSRNAILDEEPLKAAIKAYLHGELATINFSDLHIDKIPPQTLQEISTSIYEVQDIIPIKIKHVPTPESVEKEIDMRRTPPPHYPEPLPLSLPPLPSPYPESLPLSLPPLPSPSLPSPSPLSDDLWPSLVSPRGTGSISASKPGSKPDSKLGSKPTSRPSSARSSKPGSGSRPSSARNRRNVPG
jgi:hypothetical protein